MTTFDERERAFESKFKTDEELRFKVAARRDRLLGLWAAQQMGKSDREAQAYAGDLISVHIDRPGDDTVVQKLADDLQAAGTPVAAHTIRARMHDFQEIAKKQIMSEVRQ